MATVSSGVFGDSNLMNLKEIDNSQIRSEALGLMINGEQPVAAFQTVRDQVIFTTHRVFVRNNRQENIVLLISIFQGAILRNRDCRSVRYRQRTCSGIRKRS